MSTRSLTLCCLLLLSYASIKAQSSKQWTVLFPFDQHNLEDVAQGELNQLLQFMSTVEWQSLSLKGHTDAIGSLNYNVALSTRRVEAVKEYLQGAGIDEGRIELGWFGEEKPLATNQEAEGRKSNRRVEIRLTYSEKVEKAVTRVTPVKAEKQKIEIPSPKPAPIEDVKVKLNQQNRASFNYNCRGDIIITAEAGAKLRIPEGTIVDCDEVGKLEVSMREFTSKKTIINSQASTYSGNEMLQSAGMITVDIKKDGKRINMNGCLEVVIPGPKVDGMQPYLSNNPGKLNQINWRQKNGKIRYDDYQEAYIMEICGEISGSFGVNCDKRIRGAKGAILVKVKRLRGQFPGIAVESAEGAITNLRQVNIKEGRSRRWAYYAFPAIENEPLTILGSYTKKPFGLGSEKTFTLQEAVLYNTENGPLRLKRVKRFRKKGIYYVVRDFPTLKFAKES